MNEKILVITVSYNPDVPSVKRQIDVLLASQASVVVIDNNSTNSQQLTGALAEYPENVMVMCLAENEGIAAAQNRGIRLAVEQGYSYVLLMDQDSLPVSNMVEELLMAAVGLSELAAVGPGFIDAENNSRSRFIRVEGLRVIKMSADNSKNVVEVDHLIASGSLIPVGVFERVGLMDESLFIDYVDIDWALRARSKGLLSYGVFSAEMHHSLGDGRIEFAGRQIAVHSPLRHYYLVRNALLLYKRSYIPLNWKLVDAYKLLLKLTFLLLFSGKRWQNVKAIVQGLIHGVTNKSGKYSL
ncbi:glycosyltransferase family 2 protein [Pseudomonas lundensis]|uniref:glycosyltransferase family 2 protein n=1 Tax=Serratia proteamaculans TaxID=28151 RepID=UPI0029811FD3|nr:glycosyltransferase family 2 protein [Serratia proteamaculans]MDW5501045.1 glycosyltransferase family 2 protein [Serratia proteamaculans]MDW5506109.1 glycosyltransferase family 2 protein [Pseudomonas lundensis]